MTKVGLTIVWRFTARAGRESEFERIYAPDGDWAVLFRKAEGYLGSELHRSLSHPREYLVIDRWTSPEAFERFKAAFGAEYRALDARCEDLTEAEGKIGDFVRPGR